MTTGEICKIALQQSAIDYGCAPEDFVSGENLVVPSKAHPGARKYLPLPFALDMTCYGSNIVAQTSEELASIAREYIGRYPSAYAFETPHIHKLDEMLAP